MKHTFGDLHRFVVAKTSFKSLVLQTHAPVIVTDTSNAVIYYTINFNFLVQRKLIYTV